MVAFLGCSAFLWEKNLNVTMGSSPPLEVVGDLSLAPTVLCASSTTVGFGGVRLAAGEVAGRRAGARHQHQRCGWLHHGGQPEEQGPRCS